MKKIVILSAPILLIVIALVAGFFWYRGALSAPSSIEDTKRVVITRGASSEKIANTLAEADVIKSAFAFRLYTQLNNQTRNIPAGQFDIPLNLSVPEVIDELRRGPRQLWVTIPEGLRREEIATLIPESLGLSGAGAQAFSEELLDSSIGMEGYLFPDTYLFPPEVTANQVVQTLRKTFDQKFISTEKSKLEGLGLTLDEAVTLASLLERETLTTEERPIVAGILFNRLEIGMPLQVDATIQYALGREGNWWSKSLTRDQIQNTVSPYNTYLNAGIPPAPIANPGLTSLLAVANPEETDYFYYIHADGKIYYAEDLDGHNANVARYLR